MAFTHIDTHTGVAFTSRWCAGGDGRKLLLMAHLVAALGWLGALAVFLHTRRPAW